MLIHVLTKCRDVLLDLAEAVFQPLTQAGVPRRIAANSADLHASQFGVFV